MPRPNLFSMLIPTLALAFAAPHAHAQSQAQSTPKPRVVNLQTAIDLALRNNGELAAKLTGLDKAHALEEQARAASFPKIVGTAVLSPIYSAKGNALHSENDVHDWGVWVQSTVTILQPIYTWGKLSNLRDAAAHAGEVARAQARLDTNELAYNVKQLFYGAILAEQLYSFLDDGKKDVAEVLKKAEADQQKRHPAIAKRDYYRLKIFAAEAEYRFEEAKKLRMLARHALSLALGFDPDEETLPQDTILTPIAAEPPSEDKILDLMMKNRPEFAQLENGIAAKKALLQAERANKYPMFFVGGLFTFAYSNVREGQQSAFANDPYNRSTGGAGVGVQWTWDFATTLANESAIQVEIDELERKQAYARSGLRLELRKALADLTEARVRVQASKDAFQVGRHWLASESMGYSIGLTEIKNLIDAYLARAKTAKDYWDAIYSLNMSWAALSKSIGLEITPGLTVPSAPGPH